jgi:hypothetical protein
MTEKEALEVVALAAQRRVNASDVMLENAKNRQSYKNPPPETFHAMLALRAALKALEEVRSKD